MELFDTAAHKDPFRAGKIILILGLSILFLLSHSKLNEAMAVVLGTQCYCGVQLSGSVSNRDCIVACGGGDEERPEEVDGPVEVGPTAEEIHQQQQGIIQRGEETFLRLYSDWQQQNNLDAAIKETLEREHRLRQQRKQASAEEKNRMANNWNDAGVAAYKSGNEGTALNYFRAATTYMPGDDSVIANFQKARSKVEQAAKSYLKSAGTVLMIKGLSPKVLLFHPNPNVRMHAQRALVEESLKKIVEASAVFVFSQHMGRGKLGHFKWESAKERNERMRVARQHALLVNELQFKAFEESRERVMALQDTVLAQGGAIRIENGPALSQLIELSFSGFK